MTQHVFPGWTTTCSYRFIFSREIPPVFWLISISLFSEWNRQNQVSFLLLLSLFPLVLHFLSFVEVWDYNLKWDRLWDLSQGYTRIAAIVPSPSSYCLGIDEWICICLARELDFSQRSSASRIIWTLEFKSWNAKACAYCRSNV